MKYRHAFHAGNHADVLKHAVLALVIDHLKLKPKPFRVLDVQGGIGLYALDGPEAGRTCEWRDGVGRLFDTGGLPLPLEGEAEALIEPWRSAVLAVNPAGVLSSYPGSPEIAARLMRGEDRLVVNEPHPEDSRALAARYRADRRVTVTALEAAVSVKSGLPPPERRGLVLIDPPYERRDEAERAVRMLGEGCRRFATGVFCLWYPVTGDGLSDALIDLSRETGLARMLLVELRVRRPLPGGGLAGSGLIAVNPPWRLDRRLRSLLPALAERLGQDRSAGFRLEWLRGERVRSA